MTVAQTHSIQGLRERLKWFIVIRLAIAAVLVAATILRQPETLGDRFSLNFVHLLMITGGQLLIATLIGLIYEYWKEINLRLFAVIQIAWDLFFATVIVYITGGVDSRLTQIMFWITIFYAAVLLFRKGAYFSAFLGALLYGVLLNLENSRLIPVFFGPIGTPDSWTEQKIIVSIVLNTVGFFGAAYIFSYIAVRLAQAERMVDTTSEELQDLEDLNRRIVESLTSGLLLLDKDEKIIFWSRSAEKITGFRENQVRGKTFSEIFPEVNISLVEMQKETAKSPPQRWEVRFVDAEDVGRFLGFSVAPLQSKGNVRPGMLVIFQDLTDQKGMEEQVRRADRLAAVGEMAASIAHEIRNPLTSVSGSIEVLRDQMDLRDEDKRLMDIVVRETDRLNSLLTDFLHFARPAPPNFEEVKVDEILRDSAELFSKSLSKSDLRIDLDLDANVFMQGDARMLSQMFWNLMKNGAESMPEGGVLQIRSRKSKGSDEIIVEMEDEGPGIRAEEIERIFQPFYTGKKKGTGLGLAVVRRIVEEHQGMILAKNTERKSGAVFRIQFKGSVA